MAVSRKWMAQNTRPLPSDLLKARLSVSPEDVRNAGDPVSSENLPKKLRTKAGGSSNKNLRTADQISVPSSLPIINHAPTKVLTVLGFGSADAGELSLGPDADGKTNEPCLISSLDPDKPSTLHAVQLRCGGMHTIALTRDNKIVTWGVNDIGALGRNTTWDGGWRNIDGDPEHIGDLNPFESTPHAIPASSFPPGTRFVQTAAGDSCSFVLTDTGLVYGWGTFKDPGGEETFGYGDAGQIVKRQLHPTLVRGLENITQICCGANHALALDANGVIWAWGRGEKNQLGRRVFGRRFLECLKPHRIEIKDVKFIASGEDHSFAVDEKNNVWAWGQTRFGQAGDAKTTGTDTVLLPHPMKIPGLSKAGVVLIDGGAAHSAAVTAEGQCLVWGRLDCGQLGFKFNPEQLQDASLIRHDGRNNPRICLRPTAVPNLPKITYVACGSDHTILVTETGRAYATGFNSNGQLGLGHDDDVEVPRPIKPQLIEGKMVMWAGAGGNFSIVGTSAKPENGR